MKSLKNGDLKWIAVDFDNTICDNTGHPNYKPTKPLKGAKEALEKLTSDGWKITIFTARPYSDYQLIENWMIQYKIPFRRIICGKPLCRYIIDDKNIEFKGKWKEVLRKIK